MTEHSPFPIGSVAQEAARLIEDMATMARLSHSRASAPSRYVGGPARGPAPMYAPGMASSVEDHELHESTAHESTAHESTAHESTAQERTEQESPAQEGPAHDSTADEGTAQGGQAQDGRPHAGATNEGSEGACSHCGAERGEAFGDGTASCRICPLCRGIALLRSVRPETVDLLADLAISAAAGLREVALWSRASHPAPTAKSASTAKSAPASSPESDRAPVQDIPVDDEGEG